MTTRDLLESNTKEFFRLHWGGQQEMPAWEFGWDWCGSVPNYKLGGVYALFSKESLLYVGLGASRGGGIYTDHGLSRRLLAHVLQVAPANSGVSYVPHERWQAASVDMVATIGFPQELNYLACALEDYLISRLSPPENQMKRKT